MTDLITVDRVNEVLREIVDEFGEDYVYEKTANKRGSVTCVYTKQDGSPSCIVAQVMDRVGSPRPLFDSEDNTVRFDALRATKYLRGYYHEGAVRLLADVQRRQDLGSPWGEAIS